MRGLRWAPPSCQALLIAALLALAAAAGCVPAGRSNPLSTPRSGAVWSWGGNDSGELGTGAAIGTAPVSSPVEIGSLGPVTVLASGLSYTLALKPDGSVWAWGVNDSGQLGNGNAPFGSTSPVRVCCLDAVKAISGGVA